MVSSIELVVAVDLSACDMPSAGILYSAGEAEHEAAVVSALQSLLGELRERDRKALCLKLGLDEKLMNFNPSNSSLGQQDGHQQQQKKRGVPGPKPRKSKVGAAATAAAAAGGVGDGAVEGGVSTQGGVRREGMTSREVGEVLGVTRQRVDSLVNKALERMRAKIRAEGQGELAEVLGGAGSSSKSEELPAAAAAAVRRKGGGGDGVRTGRGGGEGKPAAAAVAAGSKGLQEGKQRDRRGGGREVLAADGGADLPSILGGAAAAAGGEVDKEAALVCQWSKRMAEKAAAAAAASANKSSLNGALFRGAVGVTELGAGAAGDKRKIRGETPEGIEGCERISADSAVGDEEREQLGRLLQQVRPGCVLPLEEEEAAAAVAR